MRFIKIGGNIYDVLAGEMLNIELGIQMFVDGERVDLRGAYPAFERNSIRYEIKLAHGAVFIPTYVEPAQFEAAISRSIDKLCTLHKIVLSHDLVILTHNTSVIPNVKPKKYRRLFNDFRRRATGFNWRIASYSDFDDIHMDPIRKMAGSIIFDPDNLFKPQHNEILFETTMREQLRFASVDVKIKILPIATDHLMLELYNRPHAASRLATVGPIYSTAECTSNNCSECMFELYGDVYVIDSSTLCPLCAHNPSTVIEGEVRIATATKTRLDIINELKPSIRRDVLAEYAQSHSVHTYVYNGIDIRYHLVGTKFAAIDNIGWQWTDIPHIPELAGRTFFTLKGTTWEKNRKKHH